ncbi:MULTISPECIES: hypothetical protein [Microbulbifer]|uniref:hypothetical protein n=1 Tax=Microbulbifer TaxID=48073 RepID=UPI001F432C91|nr:hypothetical protein [Microbulbifer zhoushanensis]
MLRKNLLVLGLATGACLALPAHAQEVESQADLDVTMSVVEDAQDAQDVLNSIELPPELREVAEQQMAAILAAMEAARAGESSGEDQASLDPETQARFAEALERSREMAASNTAAANAAVADAQLAAEAAREAIEEAVKNGLTGAEVEGIIDQMMQDILNSLPEDVREQMPADINTLIEEAKGTTTDTPET